MPADQTVAATGPNGAVVTYTAPTGVDEEGTPTVSCDHASGSTFPIGSTTVICTATDSDDAPNSVSARFTVTVTSTGPMWSLVQSPDSSSSSNSLQQVSCTSQSFCMAVGTYSNGSNLQTLVSEWNGSTWSLITSPNTNPLQDNVLNGVSCTTPSFCAATGYYYNGTHYQTLTLDWDGTRWSAVRSPDSSSKQTNMFQGVHCQSASFCISVGRYVNSSGHDQTLIAKWNGGAWKLMNSPNTSSAQANDLNAVDCPSAQFCISVGDYNNGATTQALALGWNGQAWRSITAPNPTGASNTVLQGVSCVSTTICVATGDYFNGTFITSVAEQWNGSSLSLMTLPSLGGYNDLASVSCATSSFCMAAGSASSGSSMQTYTSQLSGSAWSAVSSPNTSTNQANILSGFTCTSGSFCMADGFYVNNSGADQTLAAEWK